MPASLEAARLSQKDESGVAGGVSVLTLGQSRRGFWHGERSLARQRHSASGTGIMVPGTEEFIQSLERMHVFCMRYADDLHVSSRTNLATGSTTVRISSMCVS